jgi:hypothetical protein
MPAGSTYTPIATNTVSGSSTTRVTFSSISGSYTDLVLVANINASAGFSILQVNNDSSAIYSRTWVYGNGTSALSSRGTGMTGLDLKPDSTSSVFAPTIVHIMNYSNSTTFKTMLLRQSQSTEVAAYVGLWRSTAAINRVDVLMSGANTFTAGSTFTLYGIASA